MNEPSLFARLLRRLRQEHCLTQAILAQQVACALDTVKKLETDARRPSRQMATRLADLFSLAGTERAAFLDAARTAGNPRAQQVADQAAPPQAATVPRIAPRSALPPQYTSLIGRENELNTLTALLVDPACRLVTGPGGIGKTRIAIELQQVFACLSIFRAGFQRDGAAQVAGATLHVLHRLSPPASSGSEGRPPIRYCRSSADNLKNENLKTRARNEAGNVLLPPSYQFMGRSPSDHAICKQEREMSPVGTTCVKAASGASCDFEGRSPSAHAIYKQERKVSPEGATCVNAAIDA